MYYGYWLHFRMLGNYYNINSSLKSFLFSLKGIVYSFQLKFDSFAFNNIHKIKRHNFFILDYRYRFYCEKVNKI